MDAKQHSALIAAIHHGLTSTRRQAVLDGLEALHQLAEQLDNTMELALRGQTREAENMRLEEQLEAKDYYSLWLVENQRAVRLKEQLRSAEQKLTDIRSIDRGWPETMTDADKLKEVKRIAGRG